MDDERTRRRALWVVGIGYPLVTLGVNLAFGRPAERVLGSLAGSLLVIAFFVVLARNDRLRRRLEENRYRVFAWLSGAATVLFALSALLLREPVVLVTMLVSLTAFVVTLIAARRASGS